MSSAASRLYGMRSLVQACCEAARDIDLPLTLRQRRA